MYTRTAISSVFKYTYIEPFSNEYYLYARTLSRKYQAERH